MVGAIDLNRLGGSTGPACLLLVERHLPRKSTHFHFVLDLLDLCGECLDFLLSRNGPLQILLLCLGQLELHDGRFQFLNLAVLFEELV